MLQGIFLLDDSQLQGGIQRLRLQRYPLQPRIAKKGDDEALVFLGIGKSFGSGSLEGMRTGDGPKIRLLASSHVKLPAKDVIYIPRGDRNAELRGSLRSGQAPRHQSGEAGPTRCP